MARVSDILRGKGTDVLKIAASATVFEALEKLVEKNVGSIQVGKRADLLLIDGDPVADIAALDQLSVVFKAGVGYRRKAILDSLRGKVGLF